MSEAMRTDCSSPLVAALAEAVLEAHAKHTGIRAADHGKVADVEASGWTGVTVERVPVGRGRRRDRPVLSLLTGGLDHDLLR